MPNWSRGLDRRDLYSPQSQRPRLPSPLGFVELLVENEFCCLHASSIVVFFPSSSAIHRVEANWAQNERTAMVMGTPMNAPNIPHRNVQRKTEKRTSDGDMPRVFPATLGSM